MVRIQVCKSKDLGFIMALWCTLNKLLFLYAPFSQNKDRQIINTYLIRECYIEYTIISTSFDTNLMISSVQFSLCCVWLFATPWTAAHQASLSITCSNAQIHVHWVSDVIQPSHPLSSPLPPAFNISQHQGLFQWVSSSNQVAKVLELQLQHQSLQDW